MIIEENLLNNNKFIFSDPKFFNRPYDSIMKDRKKLEIYLKLKGPYSEYYLEAFDYFIIHSDGYDGATIVKDLIDLVGVDLAALRHDYDYIHLLKQYKGFKWLKKKLKYDFNYGKNMERLGKGVIEPYIRVFLLWLSTPFYLIYKLFSK